MDVARRETPSSGSPCTDDIRKDIACVYLEKEQICLADNSNRVLEDIDQVGGSTTGTPVKRFSGC